VEVLPVFGATGELETEAHFCTEQGQVEIPLSHGIRIGEGLPHSSSWSLQEALDYNG
jgi:hypothetical protein